MKIVVYVAPMEQQTTDVDLDENGVADPDKANVYTIPCTSRKCQSIPCCSCFVPLEGDFRGCFAAAGVFWASIAFRLDSTSENVRICPNDPAVFCI